MCLFLFGVAYELQLARYDLETVSKDTSLLVQTLLEFLFTCLGCGTLSEATPKLFKGYVGATSCYQSTVIKQKFEYSFLCLLGLENLSTSMPFGCLQHDSAHF